MTADVDAVNERLNGLVALLNVVGIDGVDPDALVEERQKVASKQKRGETTPSTQSSSSDAQILEIIKKLQQAQADSPEILAALRSPELRALASLAAQKQAASGGGRDASEQPKKAAAPSLDDVMDDDDNYPKIGPGYSDDISVVSDLTTPTVMTKQHVQEEEYYRDVNGGPGALPPMNIALGPGPAPPARPGPPMSASGHHGHAPAGKSRNLVSQVRPGAARRAIAKTGGAAAQRRLNYQQAMAKLQSTDFGSPKKKESSFMDSFSPKRQQDFSSANMTPTLDPSELPSLTDNKKGRGIKKVADKKKGKKTAALSAQEEDVLFEDHDVRSLARKKSGVKKEASIRSGGSGGMGSASGWPEFDDRSRKSSKSGSKSKDPFAVDGNDPFFSDDAFGSNRFSSSKSQGSDPFANNSASGSDPFARPSKSSSRKSDRKTKDDGSGGRTARRTKSNDNEWVSEKSATKRERERTRKGRTPRRASLSM